MASKISQERDDQPDPSAKHTLLIFTSESSLTFLWIKYMTISLHFSFSTVLLISPRVFHSSHCSSWALFPSQPPPSYFKCLPRWALCPWLMGHLFLKEQAPKEVPAAKLWKLAPLLNCAFSVPLKNYWVGQVSAKLEAKCCSCEWRSGPGVEGELECNLCFCAQGWFSTLWVHMVRAKALLKSVSCCLPGHLKFSVSESLHVLKATANMQIRYWWGERDILTFIHILA